MTVTSELHAQADRTQKQKRAEKAASENVGERMERSTFVP